MADIWREIVLKTIKEKEWKDGKGFGIWIVQKIKNDTSVSVTVRAGMYYTEKVTGEKRLPKDGLNGYDFEELNKVWKEIQPLLDHQHPPLVIPVEPPSPEPPKEPAPPAGGEVEEVPW